MFSFEGSQTGETELQIMQVNKSDGKNVDITVDTLTYLSNESEEGKNWIWRISNSLLIIVRHYSYNTALIHLTFLFT